MCYSYYQCPISLFCLESAVSRDFFKNCNYACTKIMTAHHHLASTHFYQGSDFNVELRIDEKQKKAQKRNIFRQASIREVKSESNKKGLQLKGLFA